MTQQAQTTAVTEPTDPFELPATPGPTRPRLLSHVGRWGRARRWLEPESLRIVDIGCSFGYGSAAIGAGGPPGRRVIGVERDPDHLAAASQSFPWVTILDADATELPVPDGCADAVTLLDVVEHISHPERVLAEARRVLRPGGVIVVSVPHRGPLGWVDALNIYAWLRRRRPSLPPHDAATESDGGPHQHFTAAELTDLLSPWFTVDRVARTGIGLQEVVALVGILGGVALGKRSIERALRPLHLLAYIVDDMLPTGPFAYHLAVRGHAADQGPGPVRAGS
jgi:SAM-dependent methyltransferase